MICWSKYTLTGTLYCHVMKLFPKTKSCLLKDCNQFPKFDSFLAMKTIAYHLLVKEGKNGSTEGYQVWNFSMGFYFRHKFTVLHWEPGAGLAAGWILHSLMWQSIIVQFCFFVTHVPFDGQTISFSTAGSLTPQPGTAYGCLAFPGSESTPAH